MKIDAHRWLMTAPGAPLERQTFDATPGAGEVVVAVAGCGVCHTDLGYFYDGVRTNHPLPLALGHEVSGHVVAAGDGEDLRRERLRAHLLLRRRRVCRA
jgi:6-hydroxycyclohex-1-ene-1-carbonyl-CoA dehydrogenase